MTDVEKNLVRPLPVLRVLFVDDEPAVLTVLRYIFSGPLPDVQNIGVFSGPFDVFTAESGEEALALLEHPPNSRQFDVIVVDQRMPGLDGAELCAQVMHRYPRIARVLMTAYSDFPELCRALNEGRICHVVRKPFGAESELYRAITAAYEEQSKLRSATFPRVSISPATREAMKAIGDEHEAEQRVEAAYADLRSARAEMRAVGDELRASSDRPPKALPPSKASR
jgi:CheY-like chemotaxis protein